MGKEGFEPSRPYRTYGSEPYASASSSHSPKEPSTGFEPATTNLASWRATTALREPESGRRGSNPPPATWEAAALPAAPRPHDLEPACKPGSVPLAGRRPSIWARRCRRPQASYLRAWSWPLARIWTCSRRGLPSRPGYPGRWWSLTPPFHPYLTANDAGINC